VVFGPQEKVNSSKCKIELTALPYLQVKYENKNKKGGKFAANWEK
jgi:hypothetical protein